MWAERKQERLHSEVKVDVAAIAERVKESEFWHRCLAISATGARSVGLHLAVFSEPYLQLVLAGRKTIDLRLSRVRCAPYGVVRRSDIVLVKQVGGPLRGIALIKKVEFRRVTSLAMNEIRTMYGDRILAPDEYWHGRKTATYATIIELSNAAEIAPLPVAKRDRRGWVSLQAEQMALSL